MSTALLIVQVLNGLQLGVLLFLIAAGLTLVFGVMNFINLAHGVLYMLGAYLAVTFYAVTGSFLLATVLALLATLAFAVLLELAVFRQLYERDHRHHHLSQSRREARLGTGAAEPADPGYALRVGAPGGWTALSVVAARH